jgi:hypothetical protein
MRILALIILFPLSLPLTCRLESITHLLYMVARPFLECLQFPMYFILAAQGCALVLLQELVKLVAMRLSLRSARHQWDRKTVEDG